MFNDKKSLIIYFSRADENYAVGYIDKGNTEVIAEYIKDITGSDIIKIEPVIPYSKEYDIAVEEAKERQKTHNAPILKEVGDISSYEIIYIGSPVYWKLLPEEMVIALKDLDFNGKTIKPFTTHEGSGLGSIPNQIKDICEGANVDKELAIKGTDVYNSKEKVREWILN